jgi:transcriptional regulator GlxA family with amidase domain
VSNEAKRPVVGVLLFDGVEVLDFAGPYEVLSGARFPDGGACLDVKTIAPRAQTTCNGGLRVLVDHTLDDCPPLDLVVIPGGPGADYRTPDQDQSIIPFLQRRASEVRLTASVCTGAFVLGRTGLLDGRKATTHSKLLDMFRAEFPNINAVEAKVVDEESVVTAAGVSSGIDLALYILEKWFGPEVRRRSARDLDGAWT